MRPNSSWAAVAGGALVEVTRPVELVRENASAVVLHAGPTESAGVEAAALGNNADFAPPPPLPEVEILPLPRATVRAWALRSEAREILTRRCVTVAQKVEGVEVGRKSPRLRWCGSRIRRGLDGVSIYARPDRAYGRVAGVCVCGQSLACPVCAVRIAAFRAAEVSECYKRAASLGYEARLETFTTPHTLGSSLAREIDCFSAAWRSFGKGKAADRSRKNSLGHHVGREVTFGEANGWHYHHHRCRYDLPGTYDPDRERFYWLAALESVGRRTRGAKDHAFDCGVIGDAAHAEYVGKLASAVDAQARAIGSEVASSATKGRNLASLLLSSVQGDKEAGAIWAAGVQAIVERKVSSCRWSRGLRAKVGMASEKSDEQVAEDAAEKSDVFLGNITPMQWRGVMMYRAEFALCAAAQRGVEGVNAFLSGLELGQLDDAARPAVIVPLEAETCYKGWSPVAQ